MLIPVCLLGSYAMAVTLATKKFYARVGYFLFWGMVMTFNLLGLAAGEGGMAEIVSVPRPN